MQLGAASSSSETARKASLLGPRVAREDLPSPPAQNISSRFPLSVTLLALLVLVVHNWRCKSSPELECLGLFSAASSDE